MSKLPPDAKVVVSITPLSIAADSRTFKQASSVGRLGYRSIVVEGGHSDLDARDLLFERHGITDPVRVANELLDEKTATLSVYRSRAREQFKSSRHIFSELLAYAHSYDIDIRCNARELADPETIDLQIEVRRFKADVLATQAGLLARYATLQAADDADRSDDPAAVERQSGQYESHLKLSYRELDELITTNASLRDALKRVTAAAGRRQADAAAPRRHPWQKLTSRVRHASLVALNFYMKGTRFCSRLRSRLRRAGQYGKNAYRKSIAHLLATEPAMFSRHLKNYTRRHVVGPLRATPRASLYYMHSFYQFPAIWILCRRYRAKFIYDAHDFYSDMHDRNTLSHFWQRWVQPFEHRMERACMRRAAAVVTVNPGIAQLIETRFGRTAVVLRNAHDPRLECAVVRTIKEVLGLTDADFLVVCVGQFKQGMAPAAAIAAIASLPKRHHLAFLGAGFSDLGETLEQLGAAGRVHVLPPVAPAEVVPFIRSADAGMLLYTAVSPSIERCLPNGFFQPLAAELPLLYPRLPEIRRVADACGIGLPIDPLDSAEIAAAIGRLADDEHLAGHIRQNIRAAQQELSWESDERHLRRLIESFIGPAQRPGKASASGYPVTAAMPSSAGSP